METDVDSVHTEFIRAISDKAIKTVKSAKSPGASAAKTGTSKRSKSKSAQKQKMRPAAKTSDLITAELLQAIAVVETNVSRLIDS